MNLESTSKVVKDVLDKSTHVAETGIRKGWSILDATTEKKPPSEYLSQAAVRAVQGQA
jgi:hypothetical protein